MIYPKNFETKIGFDMVRTEVSRRLLCSLGATHCQQMHFSSRYDEVLTWLTQTREMMSILQSGKEFPISHFIDVRNALKAARKAGTYITEPNLFDIARSLLTISEIRRFLSGDGEQIPYPSLNAIALKMQNFSNISDAISQALDRYGNVKDSASPELQQLRGNLHSQTQSVSSIMRNVISRARQEGYLDKDATPSVRDGRLVLPVSPMHKRKIPGIVHDESATGRTVFIEPAEIVEANNNIRALEAEIRREVIRILCRLTDLIRPSIDDLLDSYELLGMIDFIRAKALFALEIEASMPHIEPKAQIELYHAVHPGLLLALKAQNKQVVPLNVTLNRTNRILVISGPNAGGKSVCLKTVGIVQYMTQCGLLPPVYDNSHIGIFQSIFIDIGDQQSIENDLSTYSSHLYNMKTMISRASNTSLILIDEFGSGTEPQIGAALAQAILHQLNLKKVFGIITTHYQNLKHYADQTQGLINGAMLYDRQKMQPLFQLSVGYPGSSFAIEIARKIGIPAEVIDEASQIVGSDYINMDKYLLDIARDRKYWETKRQQIHSKEKRIDEIAEQYNARLQDIRSTQREIIHAAKAEAKDILATTNANIERTIREIKNAQAERQRTKLLRQQLDEFKQRINHDESQSESQDKLAPLPCRKPKPDKPVVKSDAAKVLDVGHSVTIDGSNSVGEIIAIEGKNAIVAMGGFKTRTPLAKLKPTMRKPDKPQKPSAVTQATSDAIRQRQLQFHPDIDVRGMRGDEAIQAITYFIDDAIQFGSKQVRILHGTGTGVLRTLIRQYLNTVDGVASFHDEHIQLGGAGITVVQLT